MRLCKGREYDEDKLLIHYKDYESVLIPLLFYGG